MPQSLLELIFKSSHSGTGGKAAAAEMREVKGTVGELTQGFLGMNLGALTAAGAVAAIGTAIVSTVGEYSNYVEQVGKFADAAGLTSEEASKVIQVADDMRVSVETVESAMKMALKNGFQPTVENLATLADRMKGIADPTKRAAELSKIFGKQWEDIWPLLKDGGDAIREDASAIEDGLIVTKDAVDANRSYMKSVDDLTDAWTSWKYEMLGGVIPAMATMLKEMSAENKALDEGYGKVAGLGGAYGPLAVAQLEASKQTDSYKLAQLGLNSSMDVGAGAAQTFGSVAGGIPTAIGPVGPALDTITASFKNLTSEMIFNQAAAGLDSAAALELARGMGLVNEETYGAIGLLQHLKEKYDANKDGLIDAKEAAAGYTREVLTLNGAIQGMQDKTVQITIEETTISKGGSAHGAPVTPHLGGKPGETTGYAQGGSFIIPPGFPNDTWPLGGGHYGSSGEPVIVLPKEQQVVGGPALVIQQVVIANGMDLAEFETRLRQALPRIWKGNK